jgi:crotonobetainyl-CoA:carnitine CoA-transferase CaiB-like acyl-CoA transferase
MSYDAPFAGLKVVDLSQGIAGPYAAMLLAQYGADVIKVEPPEGDWARGLGKRYGDMTAFAIAANLGKRSIVLDLKTVEDRQILRRLVATADVFMESFRPGVAARLGFGYPDVESINPRMIYLSVSGFGQTGPDAERPAVDTVFQAFTGLMSVNRGLDGIPHRVPVIVRTWPPRSATSRRWRWRSTPAATSRAAATSSRACCAGARRSRRCR